MYRAKHKNPDPRAEDYLLKESLDFKATVIERGDLPLRGRHHKPAAKDVIRAYSNAARIRHDNPTGQEAAA